MGWKSRNLTLEFGGPLATFGPAAYLFLFANSPRHVVYQGFTPEGGSTGVINELYTTADGAWHTNNLNAAAGGAPPAFSIPTAYVYATQGQQHVLYIGALFDGHVHELWWDGDWHHHDLMDGSGFPLALSEPRGYEYLADGTENVVYKGQDNHLHLLTNNGTGSNVWQHTDMTAKFGGPAPDGAPGAYVFGAQNTEHINYRSADGHINEYWKDVNGWHHSDLTARTGAPAAVDDGHTGYVFRDQLTQHVNFVSADGHIHELWWQASGWTHEDLTEHTGAPLGVTRADTPSRRRHASPWLRSTCSTRDRMGASTNSGGIRPDGTTIRSERPRVRPTPSAILPVSFMSTTLRRTSTTTRMLTRSSSCAGRHDPLCIALNPNCASREPPQEAPWIVRCR